MNEIEYPRSGKIREITFESPNTEHICTITESNNRNTRPVHIIFSEGNGYRSNPENNRCELQQLEDRFGARNIFASENEAVANFLGTLQLFGYTEDEAYALLNNAGIDLAAYERYRTSLSKKERGRQLINDSKERVRLTNNPMDRAILYPPDDIEYDPAWRNTNPSEEALEMAKMLKKQINISVKSCYKTIYCALKRVKSEDVAYCEGLAMGKHPTRASTHAWLEINNEVVELTWPWDGLEPSEKAIYFGDQIDTKRALETFEKRPTAASPLISDQVYYNLPNVKRALYEMWGGELSF